LSDPVDQPAREIDTRTSNLRFVRVRPASCYGRTGEVDDDVCTRACARRRVEAAQRRDDNVVAACAQRIDKMPPDKTRSACDR